MGLLRLDDAGALGTAAERRRALRRVERLRGFETLRLPVLLDREREEAEAERDVEEPLLGDLGTDALRFPLRLEERLRGFETFRLLLERLVAERDAIDDERLFGDFGMDDLRLLLLRLRTARRLRDARGTEALRLRRLPLRLPALRLLRGLEAFRDLERLRLRDVTLPVDDRDRDDVRRGFFGFVAFAAMRPSSFRRLDDFFEALRLSMKAFFSSMY